MTAYSEEVHLQDEPATWYQLSAAIGLEFPAAKRVDTTVSPRRESLAYFRAFETLSCSQER